MPNYAHLAIDLKCPFCDTPLTDMARFQWGYCPGYAPRSDYIYHIGDQIYWRTCKDGTIAAWASFADGGVNIGEPSFTNLVIKDNAQFGLSELCPKCKQKLHGVNLEVNNGIIKKAWITTSAELNDEVDLYVIEDDGTLKPMPEWYDHRVTSVDDC